jgi:hypothetical protein
MNTEDTFRIDDLVTRVGNTILAVAVRKGMEESYGEAIKSMNGDRVFEGLRNGYFFHKMLSVPLFKDGSEHLNMTISWHSVNWYNEYSRVEFDNSALDVYGKIRVNDFFTSFLNNASGLANPIPKLKSTTAILLIPSVRPLNIFFEASIDKTFLPEHQDLRGLSTYSRLPNPGRSHLKGIRLDRVEIYDLCKDQYPSKFQCGYATAIDMHIVGVNQIIGSEGCQDKVNAVINEALSGIYYVPVARIARDSNKEYTLPLDCFFKGIKGVLRSDGNSADILRKGLENYPRRRLPVDDLCARYERGLGFSYLRKGYEPPKDCASIPKKQWWKK